MANNTKSVAQQRAEVKAQTQPVKAGPIILSIGNEMIEALKSGDLQTYTARRNQYLALRQVDSMIRKQHDDAYDALVTAQGLGKEIPQLKEEAVKRFHKKEEEGKKRGRPASKKVDPADLF